MRDRPIHPLDPLLRPASIAVLGASERENSVGCEVIRNLLNGGFPGPLYAINPGRKTVFNLPCFASLADLPETVEHVIYAIADHRVEAALDDTINHGARAATIYSSLVLENDSKPALRERVKEKARRANLLICGANGMGFYNFDEGVWACGFDTRHNHHKGGNVALISHSGAGMSGIVDCEERIRFNLAVSTGQELCVSMDQYIDFAIEQMNTCVIGLFMETTRQPEALVKVLKKAADRKIPVVALKVGRTELSARLTVSHSGAIAGQDAAYQAVFDRYGVQRVNDMDELTTALIMFAQPHPLADGGLVTLHDSGGERQLLIDLADELAVPLTQISARTKTHLGHLLDPGLEAINPLDAWSQGGENYHQVMSQCLATLMTDQQAALGAVVHDRAPEGHIYPDYIDYMSAGHKASGKPSFLVANHQGTGHDPLVASTTHNGFPVLDGLRPFLVGVRCLLAYRDFQKARERQNPIGPTEKLESNWKPLVQSWASRLAENQSLDEFESGRLLLDFGLEVNEAHRASDFDSVNTAAREMGFPLVLKTAQAGIQHKTEHDGICLNIQNEGELKRAYEELSDRLGDQVLISRMISEPGVEMMLGMISDPQFGPLVLVGMGGTHVEIIKDVCFGLPPFDAEDARRMVDKLKFRHILNDPRGSAPVNIDAFCAMAARFSQLAAMMADVIDEIDINPVLVTANACICLDALVVGKSDPS